LTIQNADFDFRHIEPTGVLGGVMELQAVQQRGAIRLKPRTEMPVWVLGLSSTKRMRMAGIMHIDQLTDAFGPVSRSPRAP
jgi:hypothetical protein